MIRIRGLSKKLGTKQVLEGLDLDIPTGLGLALALGATVLLNR